MRNSSLLNSIKGDGNLVKPRLVKTIYINDINNSLNQKDELSDVEVPENYEKVSC